MHGEGLRNAVDRADRTEFAARLAEDWRSVGLPQNERAMLEYIEKISVAAASIRPEDVDGLRRVGWNDREVLDIALVSSYYSFRYRMADALGVELDDGRVDGRVDEVLLNELERRRVAPAR